jgi:hypothetical protein
LKVSAAVALLWLGTAPARAQTSVRAITAVSTGASDNAKGVPDPNQKHSSSLVGRTTAGVDLAYRGALSFHLLRAAVGATAYPGSGAGAFYSQEAEWTSQFVWQRVTLELGATGGHSQLDDLQPILDTNLSSVPEPVPITPTFVDAVSPDDQLSPTGLVSYLGGAASEALAIELTPVWSLYQSGEFDAFWTIQGKDVSDPIWAVGTDVGIQRDWATDGVRLEGSIGREASPTTITDDGILPAEQGDYGRTALGWVHQFNRKWRTDLTGGAFGARASQREKLTYGPAWRASLNWRGQHFRATALYDHTAQPSVVMGGIFLTDRASLRATGRFGRDERFRFTGMVRYQRLSAIGPTTPLPPPPPPVDLMNPTPPEPPGEIPFDQRHDHANRWQAQLLLGWVPWPSRLVELGLSYRLTTQTGATLGRRRMKTFDRNVVLLTLTVGFPWRSQGYDEAP